MSLAKAFGLPNMKILGEHARLNLKLNAYNEINKLNLNPTPTTSISNVGVTSNPQFGQVQGAFAGRLVVLQARFRFWQYDSGPGTPDTVPICKGSTLGSWAPSP